MSEDAPILVAVDNSVATITLNRPERHNALGIEGLTLLSGILSELANNSEVRVILITGKGQKTFCSGAALDDLGAGAMTGDTFAEVTDKLAGMAVPTICAFNGSAYGGGVELGLACDFRIGTESMRLFVPPARIGLCYPVNGIERFVSRLGVDTAKRLLLASEEFEGAELKALGYLTHVVAADELSSTAQQLAQRIANYAPLALKTMKQICDQVASGAIDKKAAQAAANACNASEDLKEGFLAVKEKRTPHFRGR